MKLKYKMTNVKTNETKYVSAISDAYQFLWCSGSDVLKAVETGDVLKGYTIEYNTKGFKISDAKVGDEIEIEGQKGVVTHVYARTFVLEVENGDKLFVVKHTMKFVHDRVMNKRTRKSNIIRVAK